MAHYGHGLVRLDPEVEVLQDKLLAGRVSEIEISELNTASQLLSLTFLLRIDSALFFNDAEHSACSLLGFGN